MTLDLFLKNALALTRFDLRRLASGMIMRMNKPPFVNRLDNGEQLARERRHVQALAYEDPDLEAEADERIYRSAIARDKNDWRLHNNFGAFLEAVRKNRREAQKHYRLARELEYSF